MMDGHITAGDWAKGIALSVLASLVGAASKLAIRKSWVLLHQSDNEAENSRRREGQQQQQQPLPSILDGDVTTATVNTTDDVDDDVPQSLTLDDMSDEEDNDNISDDSSSVARRGCKPSDVLPYILRYWGMFGMSVLNPICCVSAMNYASPSILAPFSGLTLVWVILCSDCVVKEKPSICQVVAACLIITGEVIVAVFGDHSNDDGVTVEDVKQSYKDPGFIAFFVLLSLYMAILTYAILFSKNVTLRKFAWGSIGGSITGVQNFMKDALTIKKATPDGEKLTWLFYLFFVLAAFTAFLGLLLLTACMKRYDATYSAASFVGSFVVSASIMSAIHYNTFEDLTTLTSKILYPVGVFVLMIGVYILVMEASAVDEDRPDVGPVCPDVIASGSNRERKDSEDSQVPFMYTQVDDDSDHSNNERVV